MDSITTLGDYIQKKVEIPYYQRGYIWGKEHGDNSRDSVSYILDSLFDGIKKSTDLFIQGITVVDKGDAYDVIDGQQRSVFFYLLLKFLGDSGFKICYQSSRGSEPLSAGKKSFIQQWLDDVNPSTDCTEDENEEYQDIFFFKKTLRLILKHDLYKMKHESVAEYVKKNVRFLLIGVNKDVALSAFAMMNGNRARMEDYELVKADLLRRASLGTGGYDLCAASEWDNISLRSRYAHEWDKWLYWWNRPEVRLMYNSDRPMGWLLDVVLEGESAGLYQRWLDDMSKRIQKGETESKSAKRMFANLRMTQNRFEETFADPEKYNQFGIITYILSKTDKGTVVRLLKDYVNKGDWLSDLKSVYDQLLAGMSYEEIISKNTDVFEKKKKEVMENLVEVPVYGENNELAYNYLLIRNVEEDTKLGRKFDFSILDGGRSLEHIYPKSKVVHRGDGGLWYSGADKREEKSIGELKDMLFDPEEKVWKDSSGTMVEQSLKYITRESIQECAEKRVALKDCKVSEHSIGNLLLLYRNDNSKHKDKIPEDKRREDFFSPDRPLFESRNLLHTLMTFGKDNEFGAEQICGNQEDVKKDMEARIRNLENNVFNIKK